MCTDCLYEYINPKIEQAARLLYCSNPFGPLHIVVDDWNLEDEHLIWCRDQNKADQADIDLMNLMLELTLEQRAFAMLLADRYSDG